MTKLIFKIVLVLLPVVTLAIVFELLARRIPTTYSTKIYYFEKKKNAIEVLVMGSSYSNLGIDPQFFGREAFNFANSSQCLYQDYRVLLKYLPECRNVKMVILPISYLSLKTDLPSISESWRCPYYSLYMAVQADASASVFDLRTHSALFLWDGPLGVIYTLRHIPQMDINEYGHQSLPDKVPSIEKRVDDRNGKQRVALHEGLMRDDLLDFNIGTLNEMADMLNKRHIKIAFVITPVYKTYYEHITKSNYELMTNTINRIAEQHSARCFNYFYDSRFEFDDFRDNDHLNGRGTKKFSTFLKNEVIDKLL